MKPIAVERVSIWKIKIDSRWYRINILNDAVGELIFHNRYSYANGNPVNLTDANGMCPSRQQDSTTDRMEALQCRATVNSLRTRYNVHVLWQEDNLSETLRDMCVEAASAFGASLQDKLPWTAREVDTIGNAFRIFDLAYRQIAGFYDNYPAWRQRGADVKIIKLQSLPGNDTAGLTEYPSRSIALSQDVWSNPAMLPGDQQQAWLVLHEFGHVLVRDLGFEDTMQEVLAQEVTGDFGGLYPTQYSFGKTVEYLIEAVTGTLWNYGHAAIFRYDASAGNRTTLNFYLPDDDPNPDYFDSTQTFQANIDDDDDLETLSIVNVRLITSNGGGRLAVSDNESNTLENWIIENILGGNS